jgi:hypothetical protein
VIVPDAATELEGECVGVLVLEGEWGGVRVAVVVPDAATEFVGVLVDTEEGVCEDDGVFVGVRDRCLSEVFDGEYVGVFDA